MAIGHLNAVRVAHTVDTGAKPIRRILNALWLLEAKFGPPLLRCMQPERAHDLTLWALEKRLVPSAPAFDAKGLNLNLFGLNFESPIGLAAGFDKDAQAPMALLGQGFAFVEVGTVTPKPQPGNPKPRVFRLEDDAGIINRMGFNSDGLEAVRERLTRIARLRTRSGVIGLNLGANKLSDDHASDYVDSLRSVSGLADYYVVNVSSPNTPGLRGLQDKDRFDSLLSRLAEARPQSGALLVKIAPDLLQGEIEHIVQAALRHRIDGLIVSNTTVSRPADLHSQCKDEVGGLSGKPLRILALETLRRTYRYSRGALPLIGVGGISSASDAYERIRAGASLIQLYSALVYEGPALVTKIKRDLAELLERDGFRSVSDAVGVDVTLD